MVGYQFMRHSLDAAGVEGRCVPRLKRLMRMSWFATLISLSVRSKSREIAAKRIQIEGITGRPISDRFGARQIVDVLSPCL